MPRGSDLYLGADELALFLFHVHGLEPGFVTDFRHAEQDAFPSRWGRHEVTKNGDPQNSESLADLDGRAQDFDGSTDALDAGDVGASHPGSSQDMSVLCLFQSDGNLSYRPPMIGRMNSIGWRIRLKETGDPRMQVYDGTESVVQGASTSAGVDGEPHQLVCVLDRSEGRMITDLDGGAARGTADVSAVDDIDASTALKVGTEDYSNDYWQDQLGLVAVHAAWLSEPQIAYLHELLFERTKFTSALRRCVCGTPRDGLQRRLPDYLTSAFGEDGPDFWWSADRQYRNVDGEAVEQLTNHAGSGFIPQRIDSEQAIARGRTERGHSLDHLEFTGSEYYTDQDPPSPVDGMTLAGVFRRLPGTDTNWLNLYNTEGAEIAGVKTDGDSTLRVDARGGAGNRAQTAVNLDLTSWIAYVAVIDFVGDRLRILADNGDGPVSSAITPSYTAAADLEYHTIASNDGSFTSTADIAEILSGPTVLTESEQDKLLASLVERLP